MRLEIGTTTETQEWRSKSFNARQLVLDLKGEDYPGDVRIYFADKRLILEKELFEGLPYLQYKQDPHAPAGTFKLMPVVSIDHRYAFYYVRIDRPALVSAVHLEQESRS